jgi:hypothetical protein
MYHDYIIVPGQKPPASLQYLPCSNLGAAQ